ncbi:MAG TPA: hypothetical protein VGF38_04885 [Ktedonobacterales bacterium]|jgi:hypothetical protein
MSELGGIDWSTVTLSEGRHARGAQPPAMNIMEAHTVRRGQAWSDAPADVSPVVRLFCLTWQDTPDVPDGSAIRAELLRRELVGQFDDTRASILRERHRALMTLDWLIRTYTVAWLRLAPAPALVAQAARLASVPPLMQFGSDLGAIEEVVYDARDAAYDTEAYDAPGVVDRQAAWTAEKAAVRSAVDEVVWTAERTAAGKAAARAAGERAEAAANASLEASWIAAVYVARAATRIAAGPEPTAAEAAARAALQPTVKRLQASAWALLDRLCAPGEREAAPVEPLEEDAGEA